MYRFRRAVTGGRVDPAFVHDLMGPGTVGGQRTIPARRSNPAEPGSMHPRFEHLAVGFLTTWTEFRGMPNSLETLHPM
jgi:hypothetical protein